MKKYAMILIAGMIVFTNSYAGNHSEQAGAPHHAVEGKIVLKNISKGKSLHIMLVNRMTFKTQFLGVKKLIIPVSKEEIERKTVNFRFSDLVPDTYGIRCFLDVDGNGELNKGLFGPTEPWGMSWQGDKPLGIPGFDSIAFEVNGNIEGVTVTVE